MSGTGFSTAQAGNCLDDTAKGESMANRLKGKRVAIVATDYVERTELLEPRQARPARCAEEDNPNQNARKERPMATRQKAKTAGQKVSRTQRSGGIGRGRAADARNRTWLEQVLAPGEIRIFSDAAGASNVMREIVDLRMRNLDAALVEEGGHWHVDIRARGETSELSQRILGLLARCIDERRMAFATICIGKRSYSLHPTGDPGLGPPPQTVPAAA